jgi:hypothetical protein
MRKKYLVQFLKIIPLMVLVLSQHHAWGQAPFIVGSEGIGQYGYIEKDASTTYFRLNSNTYGNIYQMFARTYISSNILTYGTAPNTCAAVTHNTNNYNFGSLNAGNVIYSSVHVDYCLGANSYGGNPNQTGFNERSFFVMDVVGKTDAVVGTINYATGNNVVLSFTISNNNTNGQALNRLWIQNDGTAAEGADIVATNGAFRVYYEAATGSETFDGNESFGELYGNYNSNSTSNNSYGNDALNISIPQNTTGGLRCYVVLMGSSTYLNTSAIGKTVRLNVIDDGISITPNRNSSYSLMKMDLLRPSNSYISIAATNFYSKSSGNLNLTGSWGTNIDGSGAEPLNFTSGSSTFNIRNNATPTIGANWTVSGTGSKIVIGDGSNSCNFSKPSSYSISTLNLEISNNGTLDMTNGGDLTLGSGGTLTNNGTFTRGSGTVIFSGSGTITGTVNLNNVTISGAVNFGSSATVYGTLQINSGGSVSTNAATYATHSTLKYNTGGTYARSTEWSSISGAGYPYNVTLASSTTLDYPNTAGAFTTNLGIAGNLSIENNCNLYMDYGAGAASGKLTILGNIDIAGNLSLGDAVGGDLILYGNWTKTGGTFNSNNRLVEFAGTTNSTITNSAGETFSYLKINKTDATTNIVDIACDVTITHQLFLTDGLLALGTKHLTIASSATITGGSDDSYVNTDNTGTLRKVFSATGSFTFPVGYTANSSLNFYDPITLNFTSGTFAGGAYAAVRAPNLKHSNNISSGHYLNRHWVVTQSGITSFNCNVTCVYSNYDIVGDEANIYCGKYNGSQWYLGSQADAATNTLTFNNNTSFSDFTGGELSAMPVQWLFHHCKPHNGKVQLSWGVSEEPATGIYTIERSAEGRDWKPLGTKTPAGPSFTSTTYQFVDASPLTQNFYRIKHTENNGEVQHSEICYAQLSTAEKPVIKTDAAGTEVVVSFELSGEHAGTLTLFDATGRKLKSSAMNGKTGRIQTVELPPGIYELLLEGPGIRYSQKVMIAR